MVSGQVEASATVVFDFEPDTLEGWIGSGTIYEISLSKERVYHGKYSLRAKVRLDNERDLREGALQVMLPGNMEGYKIEAWVWLPAEAKGDRSKPNGIRIQVQDWQWRSKFGAWKNIGSKEVPVNEWAKIELTPTATPAPGEVSWMDDDFDPTQVIVVGVQIAVGVSSSVPYDGPFWVDLVTIPMAPLVVPPSDYTFDFDNLTHEIQRDKPFIYGPYWDVDPDWGADAWQSKDITVENGAIAIKANFRTDIGDRVQKGYIGVEHRPNADISNKDNRRLRAEIRFDKPVGIYTERGETRVDMVTSLWVLDKRDGQPDWRWYKSLDIPVGDSGRQEIVFDLDDLEQRDQRFLANPIKDENLKNILKFGIQFWANRPYAGKIYLDNITLGGKEKDNFVNRNEGFVKRDGDQFKLDGLPYYFAGNNCYYLFYKSHFMIDDLMAAMARNGVKVVRTWGFSDGLAPFADDGDGIANGNEGNAFQPELGKYFEPTFVNFDYVIKSAGEHGVRLIIPLVNFWSDRDVPEGQNAFGGMGQYLDWLGLKEKWTQDNKDLFYTDPNAKEAYKKYVHKMVTRRNTLTDMPYNEDQTILAWELANEPCAADKSGDTLYQWASEMSAFIKSLDQNHLVAIGDEGWLDGENGVDWERNLEIDTIDFGTVHVYPDHWQKDLAWSKQWIEEHIAEAQQVGKPVVFEEFGRKFEKGDRNAVYKDWFKLFEQGADGDCVWMIAGKQDDDTLYPDYDGFTFWSDSSTMNLVRLHALCGYDKFSCWDVNQDGIVDILDLVAVGREFGNSPPQNPRVDVNADCIVDILDLVIVGQHFGE